MVATTSVCTTAIGTTTITTNGDTINDTGSTDILLGRSLAIINNNTNQNQEDESTLNSFSYHHHHHQDSTTFPSFNQFLATNSSLPLDNNNSNNVNFQPNLDGGNNYLQGLFDDSKVAIDTNNHTSVTSHDDKSIVKDKSLTNSSKKESRFESLLKSLDLDGRFNKSGSSNNVLEATNVEATTTTVPISSLTTARSSSSRTTSKTATSAVAPSPINNVAASLSSDNDIIETNLSIISDTKSKSSSRRRRKPRPLNDVPLFDNNNNNNNSATISTSLSLATSTEFCSPTPINASKHEGILTPLPMTSLLDLQSPPFMTSSAFDASSSQLSIPSVSGVSVHTPPMRKEPSK
eukprot:TRINITY_DN2426_c1_g2_i1.p1 TRINITY_DN2426_c1_g2~~TRINITY_DN2426_c1_g2_i1.p1  ORF type:complete len:409 (+),score=143.43 TRINITY_DN2426_c1_g2_i1:182-1228(+)